MQLSAAPYLQLRSSGVCLFVSVYFALFLVASVVLFSPVFRSTLDHHPGTSPRHRHSRGDSSHDLYGWEHSLFLNLSGGGAPRGLRWPVPSPGPINCSTLQEVRDLEFLAAGWTKAVYRGVFRGEPVAIKTVNLNGHDFRECQERLPPGQASLPVCYRRTAAKLLKELILLAEITHDNIIKVVGCCVPDAVGPVVIATELGEPLDTVQLLQLSWERRLSLVHGVARLLHHLAHSPLGSLSMNDLRRQQFVLVRGELKLSDVDDMGISEPFCQTDTDCGRHLLPNISDKVATPCVKNQCEGHNERLNIWRAGQHFVRQLLPLRAPSSLEPQIQLLLEAYSDTSWSAERILQATEQLLHSTDQSQSQSDDYHEFPNSHLPGQFDYWCQRSESATSCRITVHSKTEAVSLCDHDRQCKVVILEPSEHNSDKLKVTLKSGFSTPSSQKGYHLLLKPR